MVHSEADRRKANNLLRATIGFTVLEALASITAGLGSSLISLLGFGLDSLIEVIAASLILQHFMIEARVGIVDEVRERRVLRLVAVTFFALATYLIVEGIRALLQGSVPGRNVWGMVITGVSALVMLLLSYQKKLLGKRLGSRLLIADSAESRLCGILAITTFIGLITFRLLGWSWIDPLTGFVVAFFAINEGREAWEGELVCESD